MVSILYILHRLRLLSILLTTVEIFYLPKRFALKFTHSSRGISFNSFKKVLLILRLRPLEATKGPYDRL